MTHVACGDCERIRAGFIAQPANTASSLAYVVAGAVVVRRATGEEPAGWARRRRVAVGVAAIAAGVGSVAYHGPGGAAGKALHDGALAALVVAEGVRAAFDRRRPRTSTAMLSALAAGLHATSRTGGPLCRPDSLLQGHAAWHILSAASVVLSDRR